MLSTEYSWSALRRGLGHRALVGTAAAVIGISACFAIASMTGAALTVAVRDATATPVPVGAGVVATRRGRRRLSVRSAGRPGRPSATGLPPGDHGRPAGQCGAAAAGGDHRLDGELVVGDARCRGPRAGAGRGTRTAIDPAGRWARSARGHPVRPPIRRTAGDRGRPASQPGQPGPPGQPTMANGHRRSLAPGPDPHGGRRPGAAPHLVGSAFAEDEQPPNVVQPAPYTFAVWLPIFASSLGYAGLQARESGRDDELMRAIGWPLAGAFASTGVWAPLVRTGKYWSAQAALVGIAAVAETARRRVGRAGPPTTDRAVDAASTLTAGMLAAWGVTATGVNLASMLASKGVTPGWEPPNRRCCGIAAGPGCRRRDRDQVNRGRPGQRGVRRHPDLGPGRRHCRATEAITDRGDRRRHRHGSDRGRRNSSAALDTANPAGRTCRVSGTTRPSEWVFPGDRPVISAEDRSRRSPPGSRCG